MKKKKVFTAKRAAWILMGIIISLLLTTMHITESKDVNDFYAIDVYDVPQNIIKLNNLGFTYNVLEKVFEITEEQASKIIQISSQDIVWNYLVADIDILNRDSFTWIINCYDKQMVLTSQQQHVLKQGQNLLPVNWTDCAYMEIKLENAAGTEFSIEGIQLRSDVPVFSWMRFLKINVFFFLAYIIATGILWKILRKKLKKINWYQPVELLQSYYIKVGECVIRRSRVEKRKINHRIITLLLSGGFLYLNLMFNTGRFFMTFSRQLFIFSILFFIIALLCIEKPLVRVDWNNPIAVSWICMVSIMCLSDFLVSKEFSGAGYMFLLVMGFLYFIWNNMERPLALMKDLINALHITFLFVAIFCILCRPDMGMGRYMGSFFNPNTFAAYLVPVFAAACESLTKSILNNKKTLWKLLWCLEVVAILFFVWKTQSRAGIFGIAGIALLYGINWWKDRKSICRIFHLYHILILFFAAVQWGGMEWSVNHLPYYLGTKVELEKDAYKVPIEGEVTFLFGLNVQAAENSNESSRVIKTFRSGSLEELTSGRSLYWKTYLREMNLWGHESKCIVNGRRQSAHTAFLDIAYRYGVLILVPYLIFWGSILVRCGRYLLKGKTRSCPVFLIAAVVSYMIIAPIETIEQPFAFAIWIVAYFMIGMLMKKEERNEKWDVS